MKFTLIILTVLAPFFAHAGGGGGLRPGMQMMMANPELSTFSSTGGGGVSKQSEIFLHMGESNGVVRFAHGQLVNKSHWQIQRLQIPIADLALAPEEASALDESKVTKNWVFAK